MKFLLNLVLLLLISSLHMFGQGVILCDFISDGSGKSLGIKYLVKFPCNWSESNGDLDKIVKKFIFKDDENYKIETISIISLNQKLKESDAKKLISLKYLKDLAQKLGIYESCKIQIIGNLRAGEIIYTKYLDNEGLYLKVIQYLIYHNDKVINISFGVGNTDKLITKQKFQKELPIFRNIALQFKLFK